MEDNLRNMVSHRVTLDYESGVRVVGYLTSCKPQSGPVQVVQLTRVEVQDPAGRVIDTAKETLAVPGAFLSIRITEGPGGF